MQGYILSITKAKNEDLIVSILTKKRLYTLYRFYGARHSTINLGYKIDFEVEIQIGYMNRLRNITHLGFSWLKDMHKNLLWQQFIHRLYLHLRELEKLDSFYYDLLENLAKKLSKQHPKRAIIEGYVALLKHEGRLHPPSSCFICEEPINESTALVRGFLPAHTHCVPKSPISLEKLDFLYTHKDTQLFDEQEIEYLWNIILEGL